MRLLIVALLAATGIAIAAPASAEDVYVGGRVGGVGVGVEAGHRDRDVTVVRREGYAGAHCKTVIIRKHGEVKKIRSCR